MVRPVTHNDIPSVLTLVRRCYNEMDFDRFGYHFDHWHIQGTFENSIGNPDRVFLLHESGGVFLAAINDTTLYFSGHRYAQEVVWHADPNLPPVRRGRIMIELLRAARAELGNVSLYVSTDLRQDGVGRYLVKHGAQEMCRYLHIKGADHGIS